MAKRSSKKRPSQSDHPTSQSIEPSPQPSAQSGTSSRTRTRRQRNRAASTQQTPPATSPSLPPPEEIAAFVRSLKQSQLERLDATIPPTEPASSPKDEPTAPQHTATNGTSSSTSQTKRRRKSKRNVAAPVDTSSETPSSAPAEDPAPDTAARIARNQHKQPQTPAAPPRQPAQQAAAESTPPAKQKAPSPQAPAPAKHKRPRRTFVVRDLVHMPEIPDQCVPLIERVERTLIDELCVEPGATILVAISGGVDSVTLTDILYILSYEHGYGLHLAHVNHQLRDGEADRDEAFVRALAKRYDLPCHVTTVDTKRFARAHRLSVEEAARELRYRFLRQMCATVHAPYCAVAHTADDTAETLLLNLFRGTGLTGLAAIPPKRPLSKKSQLIRPLLGITREEIVRYATARSLQWVEDTSNADRSYLRNRVRHEVIPTLKEHFNPRIVESLSRTAQLLRQADGFIESLIESTFLQVARISDSRVELDRSQLALLHPFVQGEIIERALGELTGSPISHTAVERVRSLLDAVSGTRQSVVGSILARADRDRIILSDAEAAETIYLPLFKLGTYTIGGYSITLEEVSRNEVRLGADPNVEYFDYDRLPYRLFLRTWQAGDRFAPIGMDGHHLLIAEFLTNIKASEQERRTAVVLATADDIVWLCGYRMSEHYKLTNETRRIVRATFRRS